MVNPHSVCISWQNDLQHLKVEATGVSLTSWLHVLGHGGLSTVVLKLTCKNHCVPLLIVWFNGARSGPFWQSRTEGGAVKCALREEVATLRVSGSKLP